MKDNNLIQISFAWSNPYTAPETGPRILWAVTLLDRAYEAEAMRHAPEFQPGCGYSITVGFLQAKEQRRWSPEAKSQARTRNLRRRLQKKVPLLVDVLEEREKALNPDKFDPEVIAKEDEEISEIESRGNESFWFDAFAMPARSLREIRSAVLR
jgi:hypothetical protein